MQPRDIPLLEHILDYCEDIHDVMVSLEGDYDRFIADRKAQYAIAFSILQIGELVNKLSEELRNHTTEEITWSAIKGMRNIIAHDYGMIRLNVVWNTAMEDVPVLRSFCEAHLKDKIRD